MNFPYESIHASTDTLREEIPERKILAVNLAHSSANGKIAPTAGNSLRFRPCGGIYSQYIYHPASITVLNVEKHLDLVEGISSETI